jgi:DNA-binding MarR family transcriptional regulator
MAMSDLQRLMHPRFSQPGFSRLVQRMEADGLLERRSDPDDRRATIVTTTRAGRKRFVLANAVYAAALRASFGRHLRSGEHEQLTALMTAVTERRAATA